MLCCFLYKSTTSSEAKQDGTKRWSNPASSLYSSPLQDFCAPEPPFPLTNLSKTAASPGPLFVPLANSSALGWAASVTPPPAWPPLSSLRLLVSQEGQSCIEACQAQRLVCEPAHFRFINNKEALRG